MKQEQLPYAQILNSRISRTSMVSLQESHNKSFSNEKLMADFLVISETLTSIKKQ